MAESNWYFFHKGLRAMFDGTGLNFSVSGAWTLRLVTDAWTPDLSTSTTGSVTWNDAAGEGNTAARAVLNMRITASASSNWGFTHDAVIFTATPGSNFSAQYAVLQYTGVAQPIAVFRISTGAMVASQITINPPAAVKIFDISASYTIG
jgi:hypothetical protein